MPDQPANAATTGPATTDGGLMPLYVPLDVDFPVRIGDVLASFGETAAHELNEWAEYNAFLDSYKGAEPLGSFHSGGEIYPFTSFSLEHRREIASIVLLDDRPPKRWLDFGLFAIESRAWYEWHWHRIDPAKKRQGIHGRLRMQVLERDGLVCGLCGGDVDADDVHIDHILPVSKGGEDVLDNLQVAHSRCNLRKGNRV